MNLISLSNSGLLLPTLQTTNRLLWLRSTVLQAALLYLLLSRAIHREAYCRAFGRSIPLISSRSGGPLGPSSLTLHYKDRNLCNVHDRPSFTLRKRVTWPWIALSTDGAPKNIPLKAAWCWTMLQFVSITAPSLRADLVTRKLFQSGAASFGAVPLYDGLSLS